MRLSVFQRATRRGGRPVVPNFVLAGAPRCGTTSLIHYLREHPGVAMLGTADFREVGGMDKALPLTNLFASNELTDWAAAWRTISKRYAGEVAALGVPVRYALYHPHIAFNIREQLPGARVLFILRNPVDRAYSGYTYKGVKRDCSFEEYLELEELQLEKFTRHENRDRWMQYFTGQVDPGGVVDRGVYYPYLRRYVELFGREQVHVVNTDDLRTDPRAAMSALVRWLGVDDRFEFTRTDEIRGGSGAREPMAPATRRLLLDFYRPFNLKLFALLGWREDTWTE